MDCWHIWYYGRAIARGLAIGFVLALGYSGVVLAQLAGGLQFPGPGTPHSSAAYAGPGDSKTFVSWGSCAFALSLALASTSTSLCDLVAVTGGAAVGTLRASSSGAVDQTAYFAGSLTPAAACAAASGGSCRISKVYDQAGGTTGWVQATLSKMPDLNFTGINSLPAIGCVSSRATALISSALGGSTAAPFTIEAVASRTANFTTIQTAIGTNADNELGFSSSANSAFIYANGGGTLDKTSGVTDSSAHVLQGTGNGASSTLNVDSLTQVTPGTNPGSGPVAAAAVGICSAADGTTNPLTGLVGEAGFYAGAYSSAVQSNAQLAARWNIP